MRKLSVILFFLCFATSLYAQKVSPKPKGALRIMSYNIRNCRGIDDKTDIDRATRVINDAAPEVVAIQEVDSAVMRTEGLDMMSELASRTGMHSLFSPAIDYQGGKYGVGMLSREKAISAKRVPLPGREEARTLLIVEFEEYYVCSTHMTLTDEDQMESARIITNELNRLDRKKKIYLAGDMNTEPDSEVTAEFLNHFYMLSDPGQSTFPADDPQNAIDYIYQLRGRKQSKVLSYQVMTGRLASDHLPIFVDLKD